MGAPIHVSEEDLREAFKDELIQLYGVDEANTRFVLDPQKIAMLEYGQSFNEYSSSRLVTPLLHRFWTDAC